MKLIIAALLSFAFLASIADAQARPQARPQDAIDGSAWHAQALQAVERDEYTFQVVARETGVWSAPNRAQELRSRVSGAGLEVFERSTSADGVGAPWKLALRTTSFGRGANQHELERAAVQVRGTRVELDHGLLLEWIENGERGIEQGWTIAARPSDSAPFPGDSAPLPSGSAPLPSDSAPLWIGLEFGADLALRIDDGARSGALVDARGEVRLRYRDLHVFDASGRELQAALRSSPTGAGIEIDDAGALYPLSVDPLITSFAWSQEGNQDEAKFGVSVGSAGDVNGDGYSDVIVGAYLYDNGEYAEGRAYLYLGSATGLSTTAAWTTEGNQAGAGLGISVGTAGDVNGDGYSDVIVSSWLYDNGQTDEGQALVFLGSAAGLETSPAWTFESDHPLARLGECVATAGDVNGDGYSDVLVGAYFYDDSTLGGRVYGFLGSASGLSTSPDWIVDSDQPQAQFGHSIAAAGDVNGDGYGDVLIASPYHDNGQGNEGQASLYLGSASGLAQLPDWITESNQVDAQLGYSVASAGDVNGDGYSDVIIGAHLYNNGQLDEGRAFVFLGSPTGLGLSSAWSTESDQASAGFGASVASAGDVNGDGFSDVIVGSWLYDDGQVNEGRAFVYLGSAAGLSTSFAWSAESNQTAATFGVAVASAGDVNGDGYSDVIVGAWQYDDPQPEEGRAFVYHGSPDGLNLSAATTMESNQASSGFGIAVASAGDVNGDGFSDVIVGAYAYDNGQTDEGRAFVYLGSASGLSSSAAWTAESDIAGSFFGRSAAGAGDVNGDGYSDVIVGAFAFDGIGADSGRVYVYLGGPGGLAASAAWIVDGNQAGANFGYPVASAGDVNGDGYGDVIIGALGYDNGQLNEGRAYVYQGSSSGLALTAAWTAESNQASAGFGTSVASAGDVNRDGFGDVIVGAPSFDNGQVDEGMAFFYFGSASGLAANAAWTSESNQASANHGSCVASAGDVNGDRFSDVIVAASAYDNGQVDEGRAFIYFGAGSGPAPAFGWSAESNQANANFGSSVASAGDVNGDGYSDVIAGAWQYDDGQADEGRAFVYFGSASGVSSIFSWSAESNQASGLFGYLCASAGDVNGDGFSDVIVGAWLYDNGQADEGRTYVYLGNEGRGGWTRAAQQRQANNAAAISLLGESSSKEDFRMRLSFDSSFAGFAWSTAAPSARLEWQIAPLSQSLATSARFLSDDAQALSGAPLVFDELVPFAGPQGDVEHVLNGPFHWRARLRTNSPLFPVTPWVSMPGNNVSETKLRVTPYEVLQPE